MIILKTELSTVKWVTSREEKDFVPLKVFPPRKGTVFDAKIHQPLSK